MIPFFGPLPLLLPGMVLSVLICLAAGGRVARWLGVANAVAWVFILDLGAILTGTLSPKLTALDGAVGSGACDLSRIGPPSLADLVKFYDAVPNVLMFIPLGVVIAMMPRSRRKAVVLAGAVALPFAIETVQLLVPRLDRACQSADVADNLIGLAVGLGAGALMVRLLPSASRRGETETALGPP